MVEKGLRKCWTPFLEAKFDYLLNGPNMSGPDSFAPRAILLTLRDGMKYDGRTREGKRALASNRLRLAIATDEELLEMARAWHSLEDDGSVEECFLELKQSREDSISEASQGRKAERR